MAENVPHIAHFDLDSFYVSVEILLNPELKGKPVIVGGSTNRGVVATCSYETRKFGVHSAMPMTKALQLCPQAIVLPGHYDRYHHYSDVVTEIISSRVPRFQKAFIDEFYCDLAGMEKYFNISQYLCNLRKEIIETTGLPISCGLASAKFIAKMATNEAKPNGFLEIAVGEERDFLWPMSLDKIPGVGKQTEQKLRAMGMKTIGDIAKAPKYLLEHRLGKWGADIWNKANVTDSSEVESDREQKSMSREITFEKDQSNIEFLHIQLAKLTEKNAFDLRQCGKQTACVAIKLRYSDFETITRQSMVAYTALDDELILKVHEIFDEVYERNRSVRLIGIRFSHLADRGMQMDMFNRQEEKLNLYKAIDSIKNRFGNAAVTKAVARSEEKK